MATQWRRSSGPVSGLATRERAGGGGGGGGAGRGGGGGGGGGGVLDI